MKPSLSVQSPLGYRQSLMPGHGEGSELLVPAVHHLHHRHHHCTFVLPGILGDDIYRGLSLPGVTLLSVAQLS